MNSDYTAPDKNFDDLVAKFARKVYAGLKGRIRLAILERDLGQFSPQLFLPKSGRPMTILDAGGGMGPFSIPLARNNHRVTVVDHSEKMLAEARKTSDQLGVLDQVTLVHQPIQEFTQTHSAEFDLVLCHAVLEWTADPEVLINCLVERVKPGGLLSIVFYNIHGMIFKNLLRANYKKIEHRRYQGWPGSLTPVNPLSSGQISAWLLPHPLTLLCHSGMRVFHDYILSVDDRDKKPETVIALELEFSRLQPYRDLGRYQHLLLMKNEARK